MLVIPVTIEWPGADAAHMLIDPDYPGELESLRLRMQQIIYQDFGIAHVAIQMEQSVAGCTERHHFYHLTMQRRS